MAKRDVDVEEGSDDGRKDIGQIHIVLFIHKISIFIFMSINIHFALMFCFDYFHFLNREI